MPFEVVLPRLGWNMETGRLGEWLKRDGERVAAGELLFTVEGDKATQEIEALDSGILRIPPDAPQPGKEIPVGTLLGYLMQEGEELPFTASPASVPIAERISEPANPRIEATTGEDADQHAARSSAQPPSGTQHEPTISPRARRVARELGVDWVSLTGSGRTGRIVERDVRQAAAAVSRQPSAVSPLARRLAAELGVDVDALAARLPGKRVERADIEAEAEAEAKAEAKAKVKAETGSTSASTLASASAVLPITTVRRTIADRMATSAHTVAPVTLTTEADATELVRLRKQLKDDGSQPVPSYNDLLAKLTAQALLEHPMVNARFEGETILQSATANIGVAVDTDRGLLVPVLRDVQT